MIKVQPKEYIVKQILAYDRGIRIMGWLGLAMLIKQQKKNLN